MNRTMKHVVDVAFRLKAWNAVKRVAEAAGERVPPLPRVVAELLRAMALKTEPLAERSRFDGVDDEEERHAVVRAAVVLGWFARAGCPIVSLDEGTARSFASAPPPYEEGAMEWPLGGAYGLCIGQGAVLVQHPTTSTRMPDSLAPFRDPGWGRANGGVVGRCGALRRRGCLGQLTARERGTQLHRTFFLCPSDDLP
jgi:hypothetical protein